MGVASVYLCYVGHEGGAVDGQGVETCVHVDGTPCHQPAAAAAVAAVTAAVTHSSSSSSDSSSSSSDSDTQRWSQPKQ